MYPLKVQVCCAGHTPQYSGLFVQDSDLVVVIEREEGVVALHLRIGSLKTSSGLESVLK